MQDFPSNSQKAKATEPEKIEPVTTAKTTGRRRRGLGRQFKDTFFDGTGKGAMNYAVQERILPTIRELMHDAVTDVVDHLFFGDRHNGRRSRPASHSAPWGTPVPGNVDYTGKSKSSPQQTRTLSSQARARHDFGEIVIPSKVEANDVIDNMYELLSRQGMVSVADLFALTGIRPDHTDMKWGWTSLRGTRPVHVRKLDGYILDLPEPEELR